MQVHGDRVRAHTADRINRRLDEDMIQRVRRLATQPDAVIRQHLQDLDQEWDIERVLETNASILALTGVLLGAAVNRKWLWLPGIVLAFLTQHAVQGWCPPLPVFRRLGVRTQREIEGERRALQALLGDVAQLSGSQGAADPESRVRRALQAVGV